MNDIPVGTGALLGTGRSADVYALSGPDEGRVLRRYRDGGDTEPEARIMRDLARRGYPVPRVARAAGPDLVMERLTGPTLLEAAAAGAVTAETAGTLLADLLHRLGTTPWIHLDLHPGNVVLAPEGPVVIDWRTAREGPPGLDGAMSALLLAEAALSPAPYAEGARTALTTLLTHLATPVTPYVPEATTLRAADPNLSDEERARTATAGHLVTTLATHPEPAT
ncbi:phosphotransferase [Streptomyces sp. NPDC059071]|uniref:phosphotransferase n=1 Tax=unclassified Streptomyces TaxID=2593676 RepID=UPI0036339D4F